MGSDKEGRLTAEIWEVGSTDLARKFYANNVFFVNANTHGDPARLCNYADFEDGAEFETLFVNPDAILAMKLKAGEHV